MKRLVSLFLILYFIVNNSISSIAIEHSTGNTPNELETEQNYISVENCEIVGRREVLDLIQY